MWDLIILRPVAVILCQNTEIIQDTKVLVDDVFLSSTGILGCQDMKLFR